MPIRIHRQPKQISVTAISRKQVVDSRIASSNKQQQDAVTHTHTHTQIKMLNATTPHLVLDPTRHLKRTTTLSFWCDLNCHSIYSSMHPHYLVRTIRIIPMASEDIM